MRKLWLGWAMGWAVLSGCSRPPVLTIRNESTATVSNVVVSGTGFSTRINMLTPDEVRRMTVRPRGDSGVRVVFEVGGRTVESGEQGYFEAGGGYEVGVTIHRDLKVEVTSKLGRY